MIDASALVKLVVPETDSEAMHTLAVSFWAAQIHLLAPEASTLLRIHLYPSLCH